MVSNLSRGMARKATQFIIFMLIAGGLGAQAGDAQRVGGLFVLRAIALCLILTPLFRMLKPDAPFSEAPAEPRLPNLRQVRHWLASLRHFSGWQYALRLTGAMLIGGLLAQAWVVHHRYWVLLTIALILDRQLPASVRKALERGAGTLFGVLLASVFTFWQLPMWAIIALVAMLAGVRTVLKGANYFAYTIIMTPLIILLMETGGGSELGSTLHDRLVATLIACSLVLLLDKLFWPRFAGRMHGH